MLGSQKDNLVEFKQSKDYSGFLSINTFKLCPKIGSVHRLYIFLNILSPLLMVNHILFPIIL